MPQYRYRHALPVSLAGALFLSTSCGSDVESSRLESSSAAAEEWREDPGFIVGRSILLDGDPRAALTLVAADDNVRLLPGEPDPTTVQSMIEALHANQREHADFFRDAPDESDRTAAAAYLDAHPVAVADWGNIFIEHSDFIMSDSVDEDELDLGSVPESNTE